VEEIKSHPFFAGLDWKALRAKEISPPIKPRLNINPRTHAKDVFKEDEEEVFERVVINSGSLANLPSNPFKRSSFGLSTTSDGLSSYETAVSTGGLSIYATPSSRLQSWARGSGSNESSLLSQLYSQTDGPKADSKYLKLLRERELLLPPSEQLDWSGRGQHVEFKTNEEIPLNPLTAIGHWWFCDG
jgi:hypothetical protein